MSVTVVPSPLPPADAGEVRALAAAAERYDGVAPLNEHTLLHLAGRHPAEWHALERDDGGRLVGYGCVDGRDGSAEVVVAPGDRRHGAGRRIVEALRSIDGVPPLRVWAHGRVTGADAFAEALGFAPVRELFQLRRDARAAAELPEPRWPEGVTLRTFVPGRDDDAWLDVNARAFAGHPEQGSWGHDELASRLAQDWFDPDGFFLAEEATGRLAGFHWTKPHAPADDPPYGEVYVVGVDPSYQGSGLGKALTITGVRYLHERGLAVVTLYVEGANTAARKLYEKLGFTEAAVDIQYGSH